MAIPAPFALDAVAAHGLIARHDVFNNAADQMAIVRSAGRERRTVIESIVAARRFLA